MEILKKNAANLLKVKTIVTLSIVLVYAVLALKGDILPDSVTNTFNMVIAFYFGSQTEKQTTLAG